MANLNNSSQEEWKDIKGFEESHQISSFGNVRSFTRSITDKIGVSKIIPGRNRNPSLDTGGYLQITFHKYGKVYTKNIHLLVWDHFGDAPRNGRKVQVDHKNNNKLDNRIDNLQLLKSRDNKIKSVKRDNLPTGVSANYYKFNAKIRIGKYQKYLGSFKTIEEASGAYQKAKTMYE